MHPGQVQRHVGQLAGPTQTGPLPSTRTRSLPATWFPGRGPIVKWPATSRVPGPWHGRSTGTSPSSSLRGATGIPRWGPAGEPDHQPGQLRRAGPYPRIFRVLGLAAGAEKEVDCLATLWADNVQVRVPCDVYEQPMKHIDACDASGAVHTWVRLGDTGRTGSPDFC